MTLYVPGDSGLRATCNWVGSPLSSCALPLDITAPLSLRTSIVLEGWLQLLSEP